MKKAGFLLLAALTVALFAGNAMAQNVGDNSVYFVTYFSNANTATVSGGSKSTTTWAPDAVVRLINDGDTSTSAIEGQANGTLWASFYVFDDSEEMQQCCNCQITADGLLSESINKQLASPNNDLTGRGEETRGVIKIISSASYDPTNNVPTPGIRGWATHIQATTNVIGGATGDNPTGKAPWFVTETPLADANLNKFEQQALQDSCSFIFTLGSGYGVCTCSPEDHDF